MGHESNANLERILGYYYYYYKKIWYGILMSD